MKKHIPNLLTLLNLVSGFAATVLASQGYIGHAALLIMAGMAFDFSDGFAARLLKAYSDIGKDLDSLADVVTFGAAPGAIMLHLLTATGFPLLSSVLVAGLIPAASALRLARFNNDTTQTTSFRGMATPASAFTVVSLVIAAEYGHSALSGTLLANPIFLKSLPAFLAVMMLINMRMFSFKFSHLKISGNEERYLFVAVSLTLVIFMGLSAAPLVMAAYILISAAFALKGRQH